MKNQADKNRLERSFTPGEMVYMKLQPYVQSSVAYRSNQKLAFKYYGPFKVLQKIGSVAYRLELPPDSKIHPVLHVSQLKRYIAPLPEASHDLTVVCTDPEECLQPVEILDSRLVPKGRSMIKQLLVSWSSLLDDMAT